MNVLFVAVEMSPIAKVGGLADVIGSLPKALSRLGHDVRVILPRYRMIETYPDLKLVELGSFEVQVGKNWRKQANLCETWIEGVQVYLIGTDEWYDKSVDNSTLYQAGGDLHLFFSRAVLASVDLTGWMPDVVHCHDWHTGFVPVLMREQAGRRWDDVATVFTIHNFAYQGEFPFDVLDRLGLSRSLFNSNQLEAYGSINFLKAGCVFADRVNTVSETYAKEIQTPEYGCCLDGLMRHLSDLGVLSGILNGIDQEAFNPETDPALPYRYSVNDKKGKAKCKAELRKELGLERSDGPLFGVVSRLSAQKGLDLLADCGDLFDKLSCQLVVQGLGDPWIAERFMRLEEMYPTRIKLIHEFNAPLAQRVYAGCDAFLMPSRFEPCGLGQLIAMRYGALPVVRATGGLKDTVVDGETGFVFSKPDPRELADAITRAVKLYEDPKAWNARVETVMKQDFSWTRSALQYESLYTKCLERRLTLTA
jgi:starch synthase